MEEGGERWSKPHVSTLSLHSLFELRTFLQTGSILLDLEGYSLPQIVGEFNLCVCVYVSLKCIALYGLHVVKFTTKHLV